jgi:hypothetical protein
VKLVFLQSTAFFLFKWWWWLSDGVLEGLVCSNFYFTFILFCFGLKKKGKIIFRGGSATDNQTPKINEQE